MPQSNCSCGFDSFALWPTYSVAWHRFHKAHHMRYYYKHNGKTGDQAELTTIANLQQNIDIAEARGAHA